MNDNSIPQATADERTEAHHAAIGFIASMLVRRELKVAISFAGRYLTEVSDDEMDRLPDGLVNFVKCLANANPQAGLASVYRVCYPHYEEAIFAAEED